MRKSVQILYLVSVKKPNIFYHHFDSKTFDMNFSSMGQYFKIINIPFKTSHQMLQEYI